MIICCRGRFAPATTGRGIAIREVARREAPHNHADQAGSKRKSLRFSRPSRLIRHPVRGLMVNFSKALSKRTLLRAAPFVMIWLVGLALAAKMNFVFDYAELGKEIDR